MRPVTTLNYLKGLVSISILLCYLAVYFPFFVIGDFYGRVFGKTTQA